MPVRRVWKYVMMFVPSGAVSTNMCQIRCELAISVVSLILNDTVAESIREGLGVLTDVYHFLMQ